MRNFEIIEGDEDVIISLKRLSDGLVFKIGDDVDLKLNIEKGTCDGHIIQKFMTETDRNHQYHKEGYPLHPAGTILTKEGLIEIQNAGFTDKTTEQWKIMNTPILTIREINHSSNYKLDKKLQKLAKQKLNGNNRKN